MTDSEKKDSTGEDQAAESEDTKQTSETDSAATGEETKSESEATQEEEKAKEKDVSEISLDELLERDDLKRYVQSVSDRATAKAERKLTEEQKQRERIAREEAEREEMRKLREEEDYETIGKRMSDKAEVEERTLESLRQAGGIISSVAMERYGRELGEETVERIQRENVERGGDIVTLMQSLGDEKARRQVESATKSIGKSLEEKFTADMDALRTELGVKSRSEAAAKGEAPVKGVSAGSSSAQTGEEETWASMTDKYNAGEVTEEEYKPWREAHEKERRKM